MINRTLVVAAIGGVLASGLAALPAAAGTTAKAAHSRNGGAPAPTLPAPRARGSAAQRAMLEARERWLAEHGSSRERAAAAAALRGAPAQAAGRADGVLTGIVRGLDGRAVPGACVTATAPSGTVLARSRANGRYILPGLRSGQYALHINDCGGAPAAGNAAPRSYLWPQLPAHVTLGAGQAKGLPVATAMPAGGVAATAMRSGASASEAGKGAISGRVTGAGHPLKGICVLATPASSGVGYLGRTNGSGRYRVGGIRPGRYHVVFTIAAGCGNTANWLDQWYPAINSPFQPVKAVIIRVRAGKTKTGIDARMKLGGEISGTVRARGGGPLRGICVEISGRVRGGFEGFSFRSGRQGRFDLPAVFPGRYTVSFSIGCGNKGNYAPQWWRLRASARRATVIKMTGAKIARHVDAALGRGASISGTVRAVSAAGQPLAGICVSTGSKRGDSADVVTGRGGRYRLAGLLGGRYVVEYDPSCSGSGSSNFLAQDRTVSVARAGSRSAVNAYLQPGAGFSGVVTGPHGHPLQGVCIEAESSHGFAFAESGLDGTYSVAGQRPGHYTVAFLGCDNPGSVAPQFYNDESNSSAADQVTLTAGHITAGIDAMMHQGSTIAGVVTDAAGHRLSNVCVGVADQPDFAFGDFIDIESTGTNGMYRMVNLAPGLYQVNFGCAAGGTYASHWYLASPRNQFPDLLSIPAGLTSGIDGVMRRGGAITGRVTDKAGQPARSACTYLVDARTGDQILSSAFQGDVEKGAFKITGLAPGSYKVFFYGCEANVASQWYHGRSTLRGADPVHVRAGHVTSGIDASLRPGGSMSGLVVARATGEPLRHVCVEADSNATQAFGFAVTDKTGHYAMHGLATGRYLVTFSPCYAKGPNLAGLTKTGRVTAPHTTRGLDARLVTAGSVSGTVTDGSRPQTGICVELFPLSPNGTAGFAQTRPDGTYTAPGLAAGPYQAYFNDPTCVFGVASLASQWYKDQPTFATADTITVAAGSTTSGIDATLHTFGTITGTATGPGQAPVSGECVTAVPIDKDLAAFFPPEIAITGVSGAYSLADLQPGRYKVKFSSGCGGASFATQWWQNASSAGAATVLTVGAGALVTGIDAALKR